LPATARAHDESEQRRRIVNNCRVDATIEGGADRIAALMSAIKAGDIVRLQGVPEWLVHDLPANERDTIFGFIGREAVVERIDSHGHVWIGFWATTGDEEGAFCRGHSFCLPRECVTGL